MSLNLAAALLACSRSTQGAITALQQTADQHDLAILNLVAVDYGDRTDLAGRTVTGTPAGSVVLRDRPYSIAVSPGGDWIAWDYWSARPYPEGAGAKFRIVLATTSEPIRSFTFGSWFGGILAISSKAQYVALINGGADGSRPYGLVVADTAADRIDYDLTDLVTRFPLPQVVRLSLSGSGGRLVAGSADWFTVIDVPSRRSVYEARGRYPSLSPDGEVLAFLDQDQHVVLMALSTGAGRTLVDWPERVSGIGAWSPDGRYLLAGVSDPISLSNRLIAIEAATGNAVDMMPIGDLAGDRCVWIKRGFLSASSVLG